LIHHESQDIVFKEQFNYAGLSEYYRDFAAFANNAGGFLIFGVTNCPRTLVGLNNKSIEQFEKLDPERISGHLLEIFSSNIDWEQDLIDHVNKKFGIFFVKEAINKPIIAKKDEGNDQIIKNADIFFRYIGRTQKIQHAELHSIIQKRIDDNNRYWSELISKIAKIGPSNAVILDTKKGTIEKTDKQILVIDEALAEKIKFIKEGNFNEKIGATALKLSGSANSINTVEVVKFQKRNLLELYPLTFTQMIAAIKEKIPANQSQIYKIIKENKLKEDENYSSYVFRSKSHEEEYKISKKIVSGTPSIYNQKLVDFVVNILKQ